MTTAANLIAGRLNLPIERPREATKAPAPKAYGVSRLGLSVRTTVRSPRGPAPAAAPPSPYQNKSFKLTRVLSGRVAEFARQSRRYQYAIAGEALEYYLDHHKPPETLEARTPTAPASARKHGAGGRNLLGNPRSAPWPRRCSLNVMARRVTRAIRKNRRP